MNPQKRILIVRTDRIGDVVLSLPIAWVIKKHIPNAKVSFLVRDYTAPLVKNCKYVDEVITLKETNNKVNVAVNAAALKNKFDVCIVAFPAFFISLTLFLSGIKTRIGSGYRWYSFLFNRKVYEHRKFGERHELEYNINLLQQLNIFEDVNKSTADFGLSVINTIEETVLTELKNLGWNETKKIIIVHPGSGGSAVDLPKEKMLSIIKSISEFENVVLVITGSTKEKELCSYFVVNDNVINTAGMFNLEELSAMIKQAEILISNSTGPIHIAAALGKNVFGFYPRFAAVSPKRWGPYSDKAKVYQPAICQGDCSREKCLSTNCMNSIDIQKVTNDIKNVLEGQ